MALRFFDGYDHYPTADLANKYGTTQISFFNTLTIGAGTGRNSTNSARFNWNDGTSAIYVQTKHPLGAPSGDTCIVGFGLKVSTDCNLTVPYGLGTIYDGGTGQTTILMNTDLSLSAVRGLSNGTVLGTTSAGIISKGTFAYIEFKVKLHASAGTYEIRVNSASVLSGSSANTNNAGTTTWSSYRVGLSRDTSPTTGKWDIDDFYCCDGSGAANNNFLGPVSVITIFPDGAGNSTQMTASTGSNYTCVDEASQNSDTDYVSETTVGELDTYTYAALGVTGTVKGVQTNIFVKSTAAGGETVAPMVRISTTNYAGTAQGISTSYADYTQVYETSPATAVAWTTTEIDAAEFGVKMVS